MTKRKTYDWELAEKLYSAGQLSIRMIAKQLGCSDTALRKRAKAEGWKRDLSKKVASEVRRRLVGDSGSQPPTREPKTRTKAEEKEIVEQAAANAVEVVRSHRAGLRHAKELSDRLMNQLDEATQHRLEIIEEIHAEMDPQIEAATGTDRQTLYAKRNRMLRAVELPAHAQVLRELATATQRFQSLERLAWSLDTLVPDDPADNLTDAELDRSIAALAEQAGIPLELETK